MVFKTNLAWCCGIGFSGKLFISGSCGGFGAGSVKTGTTGLGPPLEYLARHLVVCHLVFLSSLPVLPLEVACTSLSGGSLLVLLLWLLLIIGIL